ncbi:alpha/beta fold hydrolase [Sphingobacterium faecium]|uniref:alpha/beta hydrolase n=1 Tax=Sphingobacterium faecium TaxID=34087 RepID=UPI003209C41E
MKESSLLFHHDHITLYGIEHAPLVENMRNETMIIFLHGWSGYRTGPHDIFVKMARRYAAIGFGCVRFDFGGRGFSDGDQLQVDFPSMLADMHAVIDDINKRTEVKRIILIGMCSGAKLGLYYIKHMTKGKVSLMVEISSPPLNEVEGNVKMETQKFTAHLKSYCNKALDVNTYRRLLNKEINVKHILRILLDPFKNMTQVDDFKAAQAKRWKQKGTRFFKGEVLSIHGGKDPETILSVGQIYQMLEDQQIPVLKHIIEDGNHGFYSVAWEQEIISVVEDWMLNFEAQELEKPSITKS